MMSMSYTRKAASASASKRAVRCSRGASKAAGRASYQ